MLTIGFIGNHSVSYSTEAEREKAFKELGHEVVRFQENETTASELIKQSENLDMLVYSHTHGWQIDDLSHVFSIYKRLGIPTVSAHLDRWLWLDREKDMGNEATWDCEYIFMADASPEAAAKYDELGLNWYYLKPAVAKDQCYIAKPDHNKYPHEIVFVGSKGYHHEYPFRTELINFLQGTYSSRFGLYGNDGLGVVREKELNTLYSTAIIAIGDSCFGGRPSYSSDRLTETVGRAGFIITPDTETLGIPVEAYKHPDLDDLKRKIDYWLLPENQLERKKRAIIGHEHVKKYHTYTNRAEEIIKTVFSDRLPKAT